jgi:sortase A
MGVAGRILIGAGVLVLLFAAFELWGTGLLESRHQSALRQQFETELHLVQRPGASGTESSSTPGGSTDPLLSTAPGRRPADGQPVGLLQIPKINVDVVVVAGTTTGDLSLGPGLYAGTPMPGQLGNSAIAGHRTTFGAPFYSLNAVAKGDPIYVTTLQGRFRFVVTDTEVVVPTDLAVVAPTMFAELTLTTCDPPFSASQRLVVHARLVGRLAPIPPPPPGSSGSQGGTGIDQIRVPLSIEAAESAGGGSDWLGALWWGLALVALGVAAWLVARRTRRRWAVYLLSAALFLVPLFFFFEGVESLLPRSY